MFVSVIVVVLAVLTSVGTAVAGGAIFTVGETVGGGEEPTATATHTHREHQGN